MVEANPIALVRQAPHEREIEKPGLNFHLEPKLGIAKLQIHGAHASTRFREIGRLAQPEPRTQCVSGVVSVAWLAPGEWLITGPQSEIAAWVKRIEHLGNDDVLAIDQSHARASFLIGGSESRAALSAHCPLDLAAEVFGVGAVARSLLGDTGLFLARLCDTADGPRFRMIVDQTMAAYAARMIAYA